MDGTPEPKRKLAIKKKACPKCGEPLPTLTASVCQHCDWGQEESTDQTQAHPAHRTNTEDVDAEDTGNRSILPTSLGGQAEAVAGPELPDVPFWKLLVAPFHYKTLIEALIVWGSMIALISPALIAPMKVAMFAATSPKGFEFVWHILWGIFLLTFIGRAAALAGWFERRGKDDTFQEGISFVHVILMFVVLLAISDAPLEFASRASQKHLIEHAPETAMAVTQKTMELGQQFVVAGESGWFAQLVLVNKATVVVLKTLVMAVPWYLLVALGWCILVRPVYIAVGGAYEEWDPTLAVKAMFKLFLPYLLVMVVSFILGFLLWELALGILLAVGPHLGLTATATNALEAEAQFRTVLGMGLGVALLTTLASLIPYPMFGVMLQKWGHKI